MITGVQHTTDVHRSPLPTLQWRHNGRDGVSNHQTHDCLLNRLFRRRSKKTSKLRVTGLCAGNSPVTGEFRAQRASDAENVSIWWRHDDIMGFLLKPIYWMSFSRTLSPLATLYAWYIETETFLGGHFQIHFLLANVFSFDSNFNKMCF